MFWGRSSAGINQFSSLCPFSPAENLAQSTESFSQRPMQSVRPSIAEEDIVNNRRAEKPLSNVQELQFWAVRFQVKQGGPLLPSTRSGTIWMRTQLSPCLSFQENKVSSSYNQIKIRNESRHIQNLCGNSQWKSTAELNDLDICDFVF